MTITIHTDNWIFYKNDFDISQIKENELVKISNGKERFWTLIKQINKSNNTIIGQIENNLVYNTTYNYGDLVKFNLNNVIDYINIKNCKKLKFVINLTIKEIMEKQNISYDDAINYIYQNNIVFIPN
jgi:uncharacterized protein YegJ (DUF2314 family)